MRKLVIAAALVSAAWAPPALARDGSAYVGVDAGIVKPQALNLRFTNSTTSVSGGERLRHKYGYDVDGVFGYDFGMFRLEGELAYKHSKLKSVVLDPGAITGILLSPTVVSITPDTNGRGNVFSGMINALFDLGPDNGVNGSIGVGVGEARARYRAGLVPATYLSFSGSDNALAYQAIGELRVPVSTNIDVGVKARYFQTAKLRFGPFCQTTCGTVPPYRLSGRYKSLSLLAGLRVNFGAPVAPPPVVPAAQPVAPPPPATQTCPDGSVIPATDACPAPPPPPPPPPPPVQRGERGN